MGLDLIGLMEEHCLTGVGPQTGFAQESLGERSKLLSCSIWVTTQMTFLYSEVHTRYASEMLSH
jgi:hypothetical protein